MENFVPITEFAKDWRGAYSSSDVGFRIADFGLRISDCGFGKAWGIEHRAEGNN